MKDNFLFYLNESQRNLLKILPDKRRDCRIISEMDNLLPINKTVDAGADFTVTYTVNSPEPKAKKKPKIPYYHSGRRF